MAQISVTSIHRTLEHVSHAHDIEHWLQVRRARDMNFSAYIRSEEREMARSEKLFDFGTGRIIEMGGRSIFESSATEELLEHVDPQTVRRAYTIA